MGRVEKVGIIAGFGFQAAFVCKKGSLKRVISVFRLPMCLFFIQALHIFLRFLLVNHIQPIANHQR